MLVRGGKSPSTSSGVAAREALREIMLTEKDGVAYTDDELAERCDVYRAFLHTEAKRSHLTAEETAAPAGSSGASE